MSGTPALTQLDIINIFGATGPGRLVNRSIDIVDTYGNITSTTGFSNVSDGVGGNQYVIQKLIPGVIYELTFTISTYDAVDNLYIERATNLTPAGISGSIIGNTPTNGYYWHIDAVTGTSKLRFKTSNPPSDISVTQTGSWVRYDSAINGYLPTSANGYNQFSSAYSYYNHITLNASTQQPPGGNWALAQTKHAYDGYLVMFPFRNTGYATNVSNNNISLTNAFLSGNYIKSALGTGLYRFTDLQTTAAIISGATLSVNVQLSLLQQTFGNLTKDGEYIMGLLLFDKTSDYIVYDIMTDAVGSPQYTIRWMEKTIMYGAGSWDIYLKQFAINNSNSSTSISIEIDGISTQGTPATNDRYKLVITATPKV